VSADSALDVVHLGLVPYSDALTLQRNLRLARIAGRLSHDILLLVEHPPVYTLGRRLRPDSLPLSRADLEARGAPVVEVERGGDVTWHGPGQLVGYPIVDLAHHRQDLHWYLRTVEQVLIDAVAGWGLAGERDARNTGVWVSGRKLASIGIHVKQWVTLHGFALNVNPDLRWFDWIVPCGIHGVQITSMAQELGHRADTEPLLVHVRSAVVAAFGAHFAREPNLVTAAELRTSAGLPAPTATVPVPELSGDTCPERSIGKSFSHGRDE
jgi:lipoyl(octanoyl) transferase